MRMRSFLKVAAVAAVALLAPAAPLLGGAPAARAQDTTKLTMWLDTTGGAETADCIRANAIDPFNELGKGISVEATMLANNWDATRTALAGGGGPDIVGTPGPSFAMQLALAGQLADLTGYADKFGWNERFSQGSLNIGMGADGKLYSLPTEVETLVLYYNTNVFKEHGWEPPKTLDEFMALAKTVKEAGLIPLAGGNAEWRPTNEWFVGEFLNHYAGPQKVYDALTGKAQWTDPDFATAMEMLAQLQKDGDFMGGLDRYYTATDAERLSAFGDGKAAMNIEGSWFVSNAPLYFGEAAGNSNDWGWVPMPSKDGSAIYDLGVGQTYSVNAKSANPEAAATFLDFYYSPATMARLLSECGLMPAPMSLEGQDLSKVDPRLSEIIAGLDKAYAENNYGYTTWTFWPPATETYLIENVEKVWSGDMSVADYLAGMQKQFDTDKAAGAVPPIPAR